MKLTMCKIGICAVAVLAIALVADSVLAVCPVAAPLTTIGSGGRSQIMTQEWFDTAGQYGVAGNYYNTVGPPIDLASVSGFWWAVGSGDPALSMGNDNGSFAPADWLEIYTYMYAGMQYWNGAYFVTSWDREGVDGCIFDAANRCTCVMLTTNAPSEGPKFVLMSAIADISSITTFVNPGSAPFVMADVPTPVVLNSSRDGANNLTLDLGLSDASSGRYETCDCNLSYRVRSIVQARGLEPPLDRDSSTWDADTSTVADAETPTSLQSLCGDTDTDVYLATQLVGDPTSNGGFDAGVVSENSTRIECGPNLADPTPIGDRPVPVARPNPRGKRSGR
jgi:hypothetical protein